MVDAHRFCVLSGSLHNWKIDRLRTHRSLAGRKVSAKRMTFELGMSQKTPQIGMAFELNAEHVERFALRPVRAFPHIDHAVDCWVFARHRRFDAHAMLVR